MYQFRFWSSVPSHVVRARSPFHRARAAATVEGAIDPFVKVIARFPVEELTVEEPDLEESVLRLYGERIGDGGRAAHPPRRRAAHRVRRDHHEPDAADDGDGSGGAEARERRVHSDRGAR